MGRWLRQWQQQFASLLWAVVTVSLAILAVAVGLILLGLTMAFSLSALMLSSLLMPLAALKSRLLQRKPS